MRKVDHKEYHIGKSKVCIVVPEITEEEEKERICSLMSTIQRVTGCKCNLQLDNKSNT